jgi:prevent-host-death family protein
VTTIASRDLRNHTAEVLRQVSAGETVTITVHGEPVAEISPLGRPRRFFLTHQEFLDLLEHRADPGLRDLLDDLAGDTTDDL